MNRITVLLMAGALTACTDKVEVDTTPQQQLVMAYTDKVPGRWALVIGTDGASTQISAEGLRCSQSDYPVDLQGPFERVAAHTFQDVAEDISVVSPPLSGTALSDYTGIIRINLVALRAKASVEGITEATAYANVEIDGTIRVAKGGTPMVDARETGTGAGSNEAGIACGGTADAVGIASDAAVEDVVRKLAEQFANSHAIRYSVPGPAPAAP